MEEIVNDQEIREEALRNRIQADLARQVADPNFVPTLTNRIERSREPGVTYFNPTEMETARTWGSGGGIDGVEKYTGLPDRSQITEGGYALGKAGLQIIKPSEGYAPPEGATRDGYDVTNQAPYTPPQPESAQQMATFQDAIGLAESKFGIKMGDDPYEIARKKTDAEAALALEEYFPGKTLATLSPQELKQYQATYAQVLNKNTAAAVAKYKSMTDFVKVGLNWIDKERNDELKRIKEQKKEERTIAKENRDIANDTERDIAREVKALEYQQKTNYIIPLQKKEALLLKLTSKTPYEDLEPDVKALYDKTVKEIEDFSKQNDIIQDSIDKIGSGLIRRKDLVIGGKKEPVAEKATPELKKLTPEVIKQIKAKAKTREEAEKMATDMGYDIGA